MKTKINAVDLYMQSEEVKKALTGSNLNLKDEVKEKINFLEDVSGKEIFLKSFEDDFVTISKYENYKGFVFPCNILEIEEKEEQEEEIEEKTQFINYDKKMILTYFLIFLFIIGFIFGVIKLFNEKAIAEKENIHISQFEINYKRINDINLNIAKELEIQKEARQIEKDSIKKVKDLENEQTKLRLESLNLSNNLN